MAYSNHYHSAFAEAELFDAEPLRLSSQGGQEELDVDSFDFTLDDSARIFAHCSDDLEGMLTDSKTSVDLVRMFLEEFNRMMDSTPLNYDSMRFDSIQVQVQEKNEVYQSSYNNVHSSRRRNSQHPTITQRLQVKNEVKFDPAPYNYQKHQQLRRSNCNNLDVMMETTSSSYIASASSNNFCQPKSRPQPQRRVTLDSDMAPSLSQLINSGLHQEGSTQNFEYHEAVRKLAESMIRTELSRRELMMQHTPVSSEPVSPQHHRQHQHQQVVITSAQQQLQQRVAGTSSVVAPKRTISRESLEDLSPNDRSSVMADFFPGSRGSLTNGLEHSRKQLKLHVDQVSKTHTL